MRSRSLILLETLRGKESCGEQALGPSRLAATGDGGDQEDTVAFLEGAGFAAQEADVLFVEVYVEELADLALLVAHVPRESREARDKLVEGVGDGGRATVSFLRAVREAAESGWNFDRHWHL